MKYIFETLDLTELSTIILGMKKTYGLTLLNMNQDLRPKLDESQSTILLTHWNFYLFKGIHRQVSISGNVAVIDTTTIPSLTIIMSEGRFGNQFIVFNDRRWTKSKTLGHNAPVLATKNSREKTYSSDKKFTTLF